MAWSWHTKGRRIPTLIGKDVSGRRIPGGPYTGLQAVTAAAVPALLWSTRSLWAAEMAGLAMFAVLVGVTVGAVKLVGKVDFASRNPLLLLGGYLRQTSRPAAGTLAGRKLAEPKPHRVTCAIEVTHANLDDLRELPRAAVTRRRRRRRSGQPRPKRPSLAPPPAVIDAEAAQRSLRLRRLLQPRSSSQSVPLCRRAAPGNAAGPRPAPLRSGGLPGRRRRDPRRTD